MNFTCTVLTVYVVELALVRNSACVRPPMTVYEPYIHTVYMFLPHRDSSGDFPVCGRVFVCTSTSTGYLYRTWRSSLTARRRNPNRTLLNWNHGVRSTRLCKVLISISFFHCDLPELMWHPLAVSNNLKGEHDFGANPEAPSRIILAPSLKTYFSVTYGPTAPDTVDSSRRTPGRRSPPGGDQFKAKYGIWPKMEVGG